jgi:hypothetical protein
MASPSSAALTLERLCSRLAMHQVPSHGMQGAAEPYTYRKFGVPASTIYETYRDSRRFPEARSP